jgi:hypothetical protein
MYDGLTILVNVWLIDWLRELVSDRIYWWMYESVNTCMNIWAIEWSAG